MAGAKRIVAVERDDLDFAGFAQEFVRRNPRYVREYRSIASASAKGAARAREAMARRWGLCFFCSPDAAPHDEPALWSPSLCVATVILEMAPPANGNIRPLDIEGWPTILADRVLSDGRHFVLGDSDGPHHVWVRTALGSEPLAYVVIRDSAVEARWQAAWRLERRLAGASPSSRFRAFQPTPRQRRRLGLLLDILDLMQSPAGFTSYDVARHLLYHDLDIRRGTEWKSSTERRRTMRLIEQAKSLMNGGYRDLLRGKVAG